MNPVSAVAVTAPMTLRADLRDMHAGRGVTAARKEGVWESWPPAVSPEGTPAARALAAGLIAGAGAGVDEGLREPLEPPIDSIHLGRRMIARGAAAGLASSAGAAPPNAQAMRATSRDGKIGNDGRRSVATTGFSCNS